jgi:hypothetical protein
MENEKLTLYGAYREIDRLERTKASVEAMRAVEDDVKDIKDSTRWLVRAGAGTLFLLVANLIVLWVSIGVGP